MPFLSLPQITAQRRVPFVPAGRLLKEIEFQYPDVFSTEDLPLPESYHMHESAHVIAEHILKDVSADSANEQILKFLLAESFANTVDALAAAQVDDEVHAFFLKQNCYMQPRQAVSSAVVALTKLKVLTSSLT